MYIYFIQTHISLSIYIPIYIYMLHPILRVQAIPKESEPLPHISFAAESLLKSRY